MKHRYRIFLLGFILLLLGNLSLGLLSPPKALAASGSVIDRATIKVGDKLFVDGDIDDNFSYQEQGSSDGCPDKIDGFNNDSLHPGNTPANATLTVSTPAGPGSSACVDRREGIAFSDRNNFLDGFVWINSSTVKGADGKITFIKKGSSNTFEGSKDNGDGCRDTLAIDAGNQTATLIARQGGSPDNRAISRDDYDWYPFARPSDHGSAWKWNDRLQCWESPPVRGVHIGGNPKDGSKGAAASGAAAAAQANNTCEAKGGALGWIICPVLDLVDGALGAIEGQIENLLETKTAPFASDGPLHQAWGRMRNIAYVVLIPIMLVMVIGTAVGYSGLDAYTVKRAMPRLFLAVLFITLSWSICTFLISLINVIGTGTYGLITAPFSASSLPTTLSDVIGVAGGITAGVASGLGFAGIIVLSGGFGAALGAILLYALTALLAIVIAFAVLALRQMLIILLVVLAPLAIIAWIFPGNDKPWKLWWDSFIKLLIMFPLIMALFAISRVFAGIATTYQKGLLGILIGITAYIAPFFLIPLTFKFAGGIFATITGMVNDRSRGLFDRAKKARQGIYSSGHERNMEGKNWIGTGHTGSAYRRMVAFGRNGSFLPNRASRTRWAESERKLAEATADKLLEEGGGRAFNDDDASKLLRQRGMTRSKFIEAYTQMQGIDGKNHTAAEAEAALHRAELAVGAKVGSTGMRVAAQKFRVANTNTAYDAGTAGLEQMQQELHEMEQDGLATAFDMAGWMKQNRGRTDYSSNGFVETARFIRGEDEKGRALTSAQAAASQLAGAFRGADPREVLGGHQRAVESFADQAVANLQAARQHAVTTGDTQQLDLALADIGNIQTMLSSVSPKKANHIRDVVLSQGSGIRGAATDPLTGASVERELNYRELTDEARNDPVSHRAYHDRVREYTSARAADQAGRAAEGAAPPPEEQG